MTTQSSQREQDHNGGRPFARKARVGVCYLGSSKRNGVRQTAVLHKCILGSSVRNTFPPVENLDAAASSDVAVAGQPLIDRLTLALRVHGTSTEASSSREIVMTARRTQFAITGRSRVDDQGREMLDFIIRYRRWSYFEGTAARAGERYVLDKITKWKALEIWQRRFFSAFPIPADRSPYCTRPTQAEVRLSDDPAVPPDNATAEI